MTHMLPSTVEELNLLQNSMDIPSPSMYTKVPNQGFENIFVEKRYKREVSLPNGLENWNIQNFDSYLNFEDNFPSGEFKVIGSVEDRLVPEEGDQRQRCESFSSVSSSMDEKRVVQNYGLKTFSTICMDSGSTCTSSDHSYVGTVFKGLEAEETYQNLDMFLQQVPEMRMSDNMPSPVSSNASSFELSNLHSSFSFSLHGNCSQDGMKEKSSAKRPSETSNEDDLYSLKAAKLCDEPQEGAHYHDIRRKNNIASKNCRKTRKEKQKEMEVRVIDLEKDREELKVQVKMLEELIQAHKHKLYAILQKR